VGREPPVVTGHKRSLGRRRYRGPVSAEGGKPRLSRVCIRLFRVHLRYHSSALGGA